MGKKTWLIATIILLLGHVVVLWLMWQLTPDRDPAILSGFRGNVISGFFGGVLFLFFGFYLNHELGKLQTETHELTVEHAKRDNERRTIDRFMAFLRTEQYHDVRFPNLATEGEPLGLEYTIEPVRDSAGDPKRKVTEMEVCYVVRVRSVAQPTVRTRESLLEYDSAPIHTGEYYFCRFYNGDWHMGPDMMGAGWHSFYLSGKVGPAEHGIRANDFVGAAAASVKSEKLCEFPVSGDGTLMEGAGGCSLVKIFKSEVNELFIQIDHSPPKRLHRRSDRLGEPEGLHIENFEGYFPGPARAKFMELVAAQLRQVEKKMGAVSA